MKFRYITLLLSTIIISSSFYYTYNTFNGLKYGLDFAGGIQIEIKQKSATKNKSKNVVTLDSLKAFFKKEKLEATVQYASNQNQGLIKIELDSAAERILENQAQKQATLLTQKNLTVNSVDFLEWKLSQYYNIPLDNIQFESINKIGPTVGAYLKESSLKLMLVALILIIIYVSFRFRFNFAIAAMVALLHDLFLTLGLIGVLQIPISVPIIAALLTILGYSINDTIVIFDRVRENVHDENSPVFNELVIKAIWQSLTRTIITSVTTLIAVISIYILSGEGLKDMSFVLILGVIIGTYSSAFIACPIIILLNRTKST